VRAKNANKHYQGYPSLFATKLPSAPQRQERSITRPTKCARGDRYPKNSSTGHGTPFCSLLFICWVILHSPSHVVGISHSGRERSTAVSV
jgi:hypothetical protein